jgi:hypothetical protein
MSCVHFGNKYSDYSIIASCSSLSLLGSSSIIFFYLFYTRTRSFFNKLIFNIAILDFFRSIALLIPCPWVNNHTITIICTIVIESALVSNVLWTACISTSLYRVVSNPDQTYEKSYKYWLFITFFLIPALMCLPISTDSFTAYGSICAFSNDHYGLIWRIGLVYVPGLIFGLVAIVRFVQTYLGMRLMNVNGMIKSLVKRVSLYPIVMLLDLAPTVAIRGAQLLQLECESGSIYTITVGIFALHGFLVAVVFAANYKMLRLGGCLENARRSLYNTDSFGSVNLLDESISEINIESYKA